ncbi:MAG: hypothetical protein Q9197_002554 [Variospora fuerteventurae]
MESSRIFVRGLPPRMTTDEFQRHFSKSSSITDAKLISKRRIGYVGYRTTEDAVKAVKFHNKSFINMSRINVELARSVDQENALRLQNHVSSSANRNQHNVNIQPLGGTEPSPKRKREHEPEPDTDPKLQEYLGLMQPTSKSRTWANEDTRQVESRQGDAAGNYPTPSVSLSQEKEKDDYQRVTRKKTNARRDVDHAPPIPINATIASAIPEIVQADLVTEIMPPALGAERVATTDDDWLRSRTSRLLGLVDDDDVGRHNDDSDAREIQKGEASEILEEGSGPLSVEVGAQSKVDGVRPHGIVAKPESNAVNNPTSDTNRLFVRNLPYTTTEDDLRHHFERLDYGRIEEVHVPIDHQSGKNKGFAYVQYSDRKAATKALQDLDGKAFQGRLLHVIHAAAKRQSGLDEIAISKLPLKKQQQIKRKAEAASTTFNWNSMYMNADAVMSSISDRLGVAKSDLLDPTSADAAVKQAHAETHVIQETKSYFASNGVNLDAFKQKERGKTAILIKNFSYGTKPTELRDLFETYGTVKRVLMPPSGTLAIIDFSQADHARTAFRSLAYRKFKESILFLEKAPKDLFSVANGAAVSNDKLDDGARSVKHTAGDLLDGAGRPQDPVNTSTLFVRNLNFSTTSERLREVFKPLDGLISARVKTKADPKAPGKLLSMGFGFLEFRTKQQAQAALAAMNGHDLDGHELLVRASHKGIDAAEERRREDTAKKLAGRKTKIIIKNLPFEATKKDVRSLFSSYGQLRSVRVPKKFDSSTRGFAFAEFVTAMEAENAMDALKDTHLLGRRLVLDFAAEDQVDPEHAIAKMQQKAGKQADKVALQRLTRSGRKKFNVEGNEEMDRG